MASNTHLKYSMAIRQYAKSDCCFRYFVSSPLENLQRQNISSSTKSLIMYQGEDI